MAEPATTVLDFSPDYAVPPGVTLLEVLETLGMSQAELADRIGRPKKTINEIIKGKTNITPETALQLERAFRVPASFWSNLQRNYDEALARMRERETLKKSVSWLREIPVKAMIGLGWIRPFKDEVAQLQEVLAFFGVASPGQWQELWTAREVVFRRSAAFRSDPGSLAAWLRKGELDAQAIPCAPFHRDKVTRTLTSVRELTMEPPEIFEEELIARCADAGVAVVLVPELPRTRVSGATRWLSPDKALIQLSLRYKSDDQLWFTFFHESAHILSHGKTKVFLEGENSSGSQREELEANEFAADFLIPPDALERFLDKYRPTKAAIKEFAETIGIAPGIVVGRLQYEGILPYSHCNALKRRFRWKTD